jgi:hypothetical protein
MMTESETKYTIIRAIMNPFLQAFAYSSIIGFFTRIWEISAYFLAMLSNRYKRLFTLIVAPGSMPSAYSFLAEIRTMRLSSVTTPESVKESPTARMSLSRSGDTLGSGLVTDLGFGM